MMRMPSRRTFDVAISSRYVTTHLNADAPSHVFPATLEAEGLSSMLDVGCENGEFLSAWQNHYQIEQATGVEPSSEAIQLLQTKYSESSKIRFIRGSAYALPFPSNNFDLVTIWSVLSWVNRDLFLQSLGESIRVTSKFLVIMDFVARKDFRVPNLHHKGHYTFHADFVPAVLSSGTMEACESMFWWENPELGVRELISRDRLRKFKGNPVSYHARKMVVFKKNESALPVLTSDYFSA